MMTVTFPPARLSIAPTRRASNVGPTITCSKGSYRLAWYDTWLLLKHGLSPHQQRWFLSTQEVSWLRQKPKQLNGKRVYVAILKEKFFSLKKTFALAHPYALKVLPYSQIQCIAMQPYMQFMGVHTVDACIYELQDSHISPRCSISWITWRMGERKDQCWRMTGLKFEQLWSCWNLVRPCV